MTTKLKEADDAVQNLLIGNCATDKDVADVLETLIGEVKRSHERIDQLEKKLEQVDNTASAAHSGVRILGDSMAERGMEP